MREYKIEYKIWKREMKLGELGLKDCLKAEAKAFDNGTHPIYIPSYIPSYTPVQFLVSKEMFAFLTNYFPHMVKGNKNDPSTIPETVQDSNDTDSQK